MQFAVLGSGSRGNATLVRSGDTCLMVDCGFTVKETLERLERLDCGPEVISAILVTHEHSDHCRGVGALARRYDIPVWSTRGTRAYAQFGERVAVQHLNAEQGFELNGLRIQAYPVPHDAREPCQFCFSDGERRLAILTDTGNTTAHMEQLLSGCDALMLECNHDLEMLWQGEYPYRLKQRVAGPFGHLSNEQAAAFLQQIDTAPLKKLVAMHLSEKNNTEALAREALCRALDCDWDWVQVASQDEVLAWQNI